MITLARGHRRNELFRKRRRKRRDARRSRIVWTLAVLGLGTNVFVWFFDWGTIPTGSMMPTLLVGDFVLINHLSYDLRIPNTNRLLVSWADPARGDVVTFVEPGGMPLMKRVIGVPGDTVELRNDHLLINHQPAGYRPAAPVAAGDLGDQGLMEHSVVTETEPGSTHVHGILITPALPAEHRDFGPLTLGADQYFMMGDNRDNSWDGRYFGPVRRDAIEGRVEGLLLASYESARSWHLRWGRSLTRMH